MQISAQAEIAALVLTLVAHVAGAGVLIWNMLDSGDGPRPSWRDWWPRDDRPTDPPGPQSSGDGAPPLPDAVPSSVRLRSPGRISDAKPGPAWRPEHAPLPDRRPQPARQ